MAGAVERVVTMTEETSWEITVHIGGDAVAEDVIRAAYAAHIEQGDGDLIAVTEREWTYLGLTLGDDDAEKDPATLDKQATRE